MAIKLIPKISLTLSLNEKIIDIVSRAKKAYILATKVLKPEVAYKAKKVSFDFMHKKFAYFSHSSFQSIKAVIIKLQSFVTPLNTYYSGCTLAITVAIIHKT